MGYPIKTINGYPIKTIKAGPVSRAHAPPREIWPFLRLLCVAPFGASQKGGWGKGGLATASDLNTSYKFSTLRGFCFHFVVFKSVYFTAVFDTWDLVKNTLYLLSLVV